LFNNFRIKDT